jgi:hypothetical protein
MHLQVRQVCALTAGNHLPDAGKMVYKVDNLVNPGDSAGVVIATLEKKGGRTKLTSNERAVVDELAQVIRKHHDQAPGTLARLVGLAFESSLGGGESREDRLARAQVRGLGARQQLAEAEGGSLSSEEVARLLEISKTAVLKRQAAGRLLAWREERLQAARFPRWQFNEHGQVLAGLEQVLEVLNQDERLDAWGKLVFFLQEKPSLGNRRPLDLLREGKLKEVLLAAQAYAE